MKHLIPLTRSLLVIALFIVTGIPAAAQYHVTTEDVWCQRDSLRIYGKLYRPEGLSGLLPLVVIAHGFGASHEFGRPYAEALAAEGYMCYCFDFCGGGNHSRSDGKTTQMSVFTERDDLTAVLTQMRRHTDVDTTRVVLLGESQGGMVSAMTTAARPELVERIILFYPAFCIPDDSRRRFPVRADLPDEGELWGMRLGRVYCEGLFDYDVYADIARFTKPVLLLHGDRDEIVPIIYADRAAATYHDVEYHVINGSGHGFHGPHRQQAIKAVVSFLRQ